jgi:hypothetical protein
MRLPIRLLCTAIIVVFAGITAALSTAAVAGAQLVRGSNHRLDDLLIVGLSLLLTVALWRIGPRNFIEARTEGLFLRNPWREWLISWSSIAGATPGYYGIRIQRCDGPPVVAWAVQKPNVAKWTGRRSRADEVAEAIVATAKGDDGQG